LSYRDSAQVELAVDFQEDFPGPRQWLTVAPAGDRGGRRLACARRKPRPPLPGPRTKPTRAPTAGPKDSHCPGCRHFVHIVCCRLGGRGFWSRAV